MIKDENKSISENKKVLFIRLDKIGDLVSTLAVDQCPIMKNQSAHWAIAKGLGWIPAQSIPSRSFFELENKSLKSKWNSFWILFDRLKKDSYDIAISFQCPWWVNFALFVARVPTRAGVLSQWHSFLFLNKGLRQKRSLAEQHEADYNADLLYHAFDASEARKTELRGLHARYRSPYLRMNSPGDVDLLTRFRLTPGEYVVVHPGMMGSARNWSTKNWIQLIERLLPLRHVVITGTASDQEYIGPIRQHFTNSENLSIADDPGRLQFLDGRLSALDLLTILQESHKVYAPSTGVLHLAAALDASCVGIYSPIRVQRPLRWEARGLDVKILEPQVPCPATHQCVGSSCPYWDCMDRIQVADLPE